MYTHVDVVGIAEASAALYVQKDRDRYLDVLTTIENFIYQHKCIITGESAHLLFLKKYLSLRILLQQCGGAQQGFGDPAL